MNSDLVFVLGLAVLFLIATMWILSAGSGDEDSES